MPHAVIQSTLEAYATDHFYACVKDRFENTTTCKLTLQRAESSVLYSLIMMQRSDWWCESYSLEAPHPIRRPMISSIPKHPESVPRIKHSAEIREMKSYKRLSRPLIGRISFHLSSSPRRVFHSTGLTPRLYRFCMHITHLQVSLVAEGHRSITGLRARVRNSSPLLTSETPYVASLFNRYVPFHKFLTPRDNCRCSHRDFDIARAPDTSQHSAFSTPARRRTSSF